MEVLLPFEPRESSVVHCFEARVGSESASLHRHREDAPPVPPTAAERCRKMVLQAWSEVAGMRLADGLATIARLQAEHGSAPSGKLDLEYRLLQATALALKDDAEAAVGLVQQTIKKHEAAAGHPATSLLLRLGHWRARRLEVFCDLPGTACHVAGHRRDVLWSILHLSMDAAVEAEQLRLASAGRLANEALELAARFYGPKFSGARLAATLSARILYEQNQVDAADRLIGDKLALSVSQSGIEGALCAYITGSRIAAARGQTPFAILLLREAEQLGEDRGWPRLVAASRAERVRLLIEADRIGEAQACAKLLARMPSTGGVRANDYLVARYGAISRARLELAQGATGHTVSSLRQVVSESRVRRECHLAVELRMLFACALHDVGRDDEATAEALRAIGSGAAAGLYRTFIDGGEGMRRFLGWLYERRSGNSSILGELRPYVRNLLMGFSESPQPTGGARSKHRSGESLSPRERHIVSLMSHGLSNKRIARQLGITPETVKSHAKHILLKLAAQTRVEAVSRALGLGII